MLAVSSGAAEIITALCGAGYEAYAVGGCVRDILRGCVPHDWDICCSADPEGVKRALSGLRIVETGIKHGTVSVFLGGECYEVTSFRTESGYSDHRRPDSVSFTCDLEQDLARRDFTINAMAMSRDGVITDPFGGRRDLSARLIRCVGEPERRFNEDALRILRALRFSSQLDFSIEEATGEAAVRLSDLLGGVSQERISGELLKLLSGRGAARVLREFPQIITRLIPELTGSYDASAERISRLDGGSSATLLLAALLLNLDDGEADAAFSRLRLPNEQTADVRWLIGSARTSPPQSLPEARRLLSHARSAPSELTSLYAAKGVDASEFSRLADGIIARGDCISLWQLAVGGRELMGMGIAPGPRLGAVLSQLLDAVIDGRLENAPDTLLEYAKRLI